MTDTRPALHRTVTFRSPSGRPVLQVGSLPAALAFLVGLIFFPRLTALATLAAWLGRISPSTEG